VNPWDNERSGQALCGGLDLCSDIVEEISWIGERLCLVCNKNTNEVGGLFDRKCCIDECGLLVGVLNACANGNVRYGEGLKGRSRLN
jgi:hypothetical protein